MITIILSILITGLIYMIYPFIKFYKKKKNYEKKEIKTILIWNSVIVGGLFVIFSITLFPEEYIINLAPAVFYYLLNSIIWQTNWKKIEENNIKDKKESKKEIVKTENKQNNNTNIKKKNKKSKNKMSLLLKIILIISITVNVVLIYLFTITKIQNTKYTKTINYLINDDFIKAEKYIDNNSLYHNINYNKLVNKNNNPPQRILSRNGPCVILSGKNYYKRFTKN